MYDITAEELFNYLLKDKMARKRQMLDDIEQGNLSPDAINSELLAANKVITENDSLDSDLDYIDSVLGDPQVEPAEDWVENATAQQIEDPKIADKVYKNIKDAANYKDLQEVEKEARVGKGKSADRALASANKEKVRLDRMLYNISKDNMLADSEKVDMALRLLFDYNTRRYGMYPEDIRLSQDDIWKQLMLNETPGERLDDYQHNILVKMPKGKPGVKLKDVIAFNEGTATKEKHGDKERNIMAIQMTPDAVERIKEQAKQNLKEDPKAMEREYRNYSDPTFMEKEHIVSDAVPITYSSDKDNGVQLFTPSLEANTVYEIFANALIDDIKNNKAPALDKMNKYINDTYRNKLKTMTYDDWEKEIARENADVDVNKIVEQVYKDADAPISTGSALGDDIAWRVRNKRLALEKAAGYRQADSGNKSVDKMLSQHLPRDIVQSMVDSYLVTNTDAEVPEDVLTPGDWADKMPDNPRLRNKSKEEKEDNKLNRWHEGNKEEYKKFLKRTTARAKTLNTNEDDTFEQYLEDEYGIVHEPEDNVMALQAMQQREARLDSWKQAVKNYIQEQAPNLLSQLNNAKANGHTAKARDLGKKFKYYEAILKGDNVVITDDQGSKYYIDGKVELANWAQRAMMNNRRKNNGIKSKPVVNTTSTVNSLFKDAEALWKEEDEEGNVKPRKPQTEFERDAYKWLDNMQKVWNHYKADKLNDEIEAKEIILKDANNKSKDKPKEDWEKDLVDMEEEHGR